MSLVGDTLQSLRPGAQWSLAGENIQWIEIKDNEGVGTGKYDTPNFEWHDNVQQKPSKQEYETEYKTQQEKLKSQEYIFYRRKEYPPLADLADAIYWQSQGDDSKMQAYLAAVSTVKEKYPKAGV
jgi:hypothetical protein